MMTDKQETIKRKRVRISITSRSGSEPAVRQAMEGELFRKENCIYVRYEEPPESGMGRTATTLRIEPSHLRIIRHGDVQYEQTFREGARHLGYLQTPQGRLEMETVTHAFAYRMEAEPDSSLYVSWGYELSVMGDPAGAFRIELTAVPFETA